MVGWHHQLNAHEFEQTLGDGDGQGSLACCGPRGCKGDKEKKLVDTVKHLLRGGKSVALNMPANLENSAVATVLEKVIFHPYPKEGQCQRMFKLPHNCPHFMCKQSNAQNSPS